MQFIKTHTSVEEIKQAESQISAGYGPVSDDYLHWATCRPVMNIVQEPFGEVRRINGILLFFVSLPLHPTEPNQNDRSYNQKNCCAPEYPPRSRADSHIYSDASGPTQVPGYSQVGKTECVKFASRQPRSSAPTQLGRLQFFAAEHSRCRVLEDGGERVEA